MLRRVSAAVITFHLGSSSSRRSACEKRVVAFSSEVSSSSVAKSSRAFLSASLRSRTSSVLRCCAYSLKQAFFSPRDFSAEYLHHHTHT